MEVILRQAIQEAVKHIPLLHVHHLRMKVIEVADLIRVVLVVREVPEVVTQAEVLPVHQDQVVEAVLLEVEDKQIKLGNL
ncbi:hypothetical protein TRIP_D410005 [uncultured Paludibacter sp.]|uniref:Uncharacterized protein n=1 Tax=uncultured Paludibacter sp. TaxID=497635 RepID=A0A653AFA6_9BACT|nr:hypothetical protein TRIP_D410005 [uncultured Paludibacter sp.]